MGRALSAQGGIQQLILGPFVSRTSWFPILGLVTGLLALGSISPPPCSDLCHRGLTPAAAYPRFSLSWLPDGLHSGRPGPQTAVREPERRQVPSPLSLLGTGPLMIAGPPLGSSTVTKPLYPSPSSHQVALTPRLWNSTSSICPSPPERWKLLSQLLISGWPAFLCMLPRQF